MKFAIVGLGACSSYWISAIKRAGDEITALCDNDTSKLTNTHLSFSNAIDLINANLEIDYTIVAVDVDSHYSVAKQLLFNKMNVIIEKPISYDLNQVRELYKIAKDNQVKLIASYHAAYASDLIYFLKNKSSLERNLGRLIEINAHFYDPYFNNGLLSPKANGLHGSYLDSAINAFSVLDKLINLNNCSKTYFDKKYLSSDNLSSLTKLKADDISINVYTNWTLGENKKITLLKYEFGTLLLNHTDEAISCNDKVYSLKNNYTRLENQYYNQLIYFKANNFNLDDNIMISKLLLE